MMIQVSEGGSEHGVFSCFHFVVFVVFLGFVLVSSMSIVIISVLGFDVSLVFLESLVRSHYKILIWNNKFVLVYWFCYGSAVFVSGQGLIRYGFRSDGMRCLVMYPMCLTSLSQTQIPLQFFETKFMDVEYGCTFSQMRLIWHVLEVFIEWVLFGMEWTQWLMQLWSGYLDYGNCMVFPKIWLLWNFRLRQRIYFKCLWVVPVCFGYEVWFDGLITSLCPNLCSLFIYLFYWISWLYECLNGYQATGFRRSSYKYAVWIEVILRRRVDVFTSYVGIFISVYGQIGPLHSRLTSSVELIFWNFL